MDSPFVTFLKKWLWALPLAGGLWWALTTGYTVMEENINMKRDLIELKDKMDDQLKNQLTEKDVLILIQLATQNTKQNINSLEKILAK